MQTIKEYRAQRMSDYWAEGTTVHAVGTGEEVTTLCGKITKVTSRSESKLYIRNNCEIDCFYCLEILDLQIEAHAETSQYSFLIV